MAILKFKLHGEHDGRPVSIAMHKFVVRVDDDHDASIIPHLLNLAEVWIKAEAKQADLTLRRAAAADSRPADDQSSRD